MAKRKVYKVVLEDHDNLTVRAHGTSIDGAVTFTRIGMNLGGILADTPEGAAQRDELYRELSGVLIGWDLEEDDGTPVPCTEAALRGQDWAVVMDLFRGWVSATMSVPDPLEHRSNGGEPSPEVSLPMEVLSPSLSS